VGLQAAPGFQEGKEKKKNLLARQTERVAAQGGRVALGAEPSLSKAFQLSLEGCAWKLGEKKKSNAGCFGVRLGSFEAITAITAILLCANLALQNASN